MPDELNLFPASTVDEDFIPVIADFFIKDERETLERWARQVGGWQVLGRVLQSIFARY